jgi:hypothetical protein
MASSNKMFTILFHGNCIDGWMSTFIAYTYLKEHGSVKMFPIAPNQPNTWTHYSQLTQSHVLLLDLSLPQNTREFYLKHGALSIQCIDHHESSISHWNPQECPINTSTCAAVQTWKHYYPQQDIPYWLSAIDRIDRWDNPTEHDRYLREIFYQIARLPVQKKIPEAIQLTEQLLSQVNNPEAITAQLQRGKEILEQKDAHLLQVLSTGSFHTFTPEYLQAWNLTPNWLGLRVFILDNTLTTIDSTEASHLVFMNYSDTNVFINYRKKTFYTKDSMPVEKTMYVYSARSKGFDLTQGSIFKGHSTAAGASLVTDEYPSIPFLLQSS